MDEVVRYTYRLQPGRTAERALLAEWGRCRWLWNEAVHQQRSGQKPTFARLGKLLTEARARLLWLREGSQVAQQQTLRDYAQALDHSFKVTRRGRPKVKSRKISLPSLEYTTRGFSIRDGRLVLPKGVMVPVVWSRELPSPPKSVRVHRDSLGYWYASFVVRREVESRPRGRGGIGIDWGVSTTATTTDPSFDLPYLGHRKRCAAEPAKTQRTMARRHRKGRPQSRGYGEAKRQAARLAKKAARQTIHDSRVWAARVVDRYNVIAVEDFTPMFLAKSTMARKAADAAIGAAKRELVERAVRAGRRVVMVRPAYTTMTCSRCFARIKRLELHERGFRCEGCGFADSRDRNAARVVLAVAERGHVSVEDVGQSDHLLRVGGSVAV
ncbi:RNA-guided endonuclease InsQ/TnpB family protein [Nocardia jiangxiensis]|uniref:RNA-guided endonuclease InsQ/TnpB family protein n=1 Tax=Nocardia jiangxiensis TaxID=282685 RepID=A0ABW6RTT4_9NOCA|nr:RNA-guided endonuclease TnpB family protein [Nocardia jiangxiensis]